jgi:hypothetical protein
MNMQSMTIVIFHCVSNIKSEKYQSSFAWCAWFYVEVTPAINAEKTKYMSMSQQWFLGQNYNIKLANKSFEDLSFRNDTIKTAFTKNLRAD